MSCYVEKIRQLSNELFCFIGNCMVRMFFEVRSSGGLTMYFV